MARSRAHGVPLFILAVLALMAVGACSTAAGPATPPAATAPVTVAPTPSPAPPIATPAATIVDGMLVTTSTVDPIVWYGVQCDPTAEAWVVGGTVESDGYAETWTYTATIDPETRAGTYVYEASGEIAGGSLTKKGTGIASVSDADGVTVLTVGDSNVTGTITAGGTT